LRLFREGQCSGQCNMSGKAEYDEPTVVSVCVPGAASAWDGTTRTMMLTPSVSLQPNTRYTVHADHQHFTGEQGAPLYSSYSFGFTTGAPPTIRLLACLGSEGGGGAGAADSGWAAMDVCLGAEPLADLRRALCQRLQLADEDIERVCQEVCEEVSVSLEDDGDAAQLRGEDRVVVHRRPQRKAGSKRALAASPSASVAAGDSDGGGAQAGGEKRQRTAAGAGDGTELAKRQAAEAALAAAELRLAEVERRAAVLEAQVARGAQAHTEAVAIDVEALDAGGGGAGAGAGGSGSGSGSGSSGLAQLHASHQALLHVKKEKAEADENLEEKDELCNQVVLSEDRKNDTIDRLKALLQQKGASAHEIAQAVAGL
jgi:hypothetical protein